MTRRNNLIVVFETVYFIKSIYKEFIRVIRHLYEEKSQNFENVEIIYLLKITNRINDTFTLNILWFDTKFVK